MRERERQREKGERERLRETLYLGLDADDGCAGGNTAGLVSSLEWCVFPPL